MKPVALAATLAVLLAGCGQPRIDGSSIDAATKSIARIRAKLPPEKAAKFGEAAGELMLASALPAALVGAKPDATMTAALAQLDGKTADEVIAIAEARERERVEQRRADLQKRIAELEQEQAKAEAVLVDLRRFEILSAAFRHDRDTFGLSKPVISLTVRNGTATPVSRAYFRGTLSSPGRAVPWLAEDFNYSIPGGLEPGEMADWTLAPNSFGPWGRVEAPADAVFSVELVNLDGAEGVKLAPDFSEHDKKRLADLRAELAGQSP